MDKSYLSGNKIQLIPNQGVEKLAEIQSVTNMIPPTINKNISRLSILSSFLPLRSILRNKDM